MEKMDGVQRSAYLAGVVEGLAYARYRQDGEATTGMGCIYRWFCQRKETLRDIHAAFERFADHSPGAVIAAMIRKECP